MFIELHMLQNFVPANLNRDDTNNPKDAEFGGQRRARISSQCLKRAIRTNDVFAKVTDMPIGDRTKKMATALAKQLKEAGKVEKFEDAMSVATVVVAAYYSKKEKMDNKDPEKTAYLVYFSQAEIGALTQTVLENWDNLTPPQDKKSEKSAVNLVAPLIKETKNRTSAPDIAMFGRMLADQPNLNLNAACQVAHAISTHRITMEMDYFTAVDDLNPTEETGAGMVGFSGFNSACFYRYARIDWRQLVTNLNGDTDLASRTVQGFIRSAITAVPSGKQNSTAPFNPPNFILAVVRQDGMGWNLANAFETPVRPKFDEGLVGPSLAKLDAYWKCLTGVYGQDTLTGVFALPLDPDLSLDALKAHKVASLKDMLEGVNTVITTSGATA
jgi:CRISPR system Cascade subunit CasC